MSHHASNDSFEDLAKFICKCRSVCMALELHIMTIFSKLILSIRVASCYANSMVLKDFSVGRKNMCRRRYNRIM